MIKCIRKAAAYAFLAANSLLLLPSAAMAAGSAIPPQNSDALTQKLKSLVETVGIPVGSVVLFLSVCIVAIELMLARGKPEKRAETMSGILYIAMGGILLGGALFFAGVFYGWGQNVFK